MEKMKSPRDVDYEEVEEEINQPELEFDVENTIVQVADGVVISNDDELFRLIFYYIKPGENPKIHDKIECKAVIELRVSKSKFLEMAKEFEEKAKGNRSYHRKLSDFMFG